MASTTAPTTTTTDHRLGFENQTEEVRVDALAVDGEVPAWLQGALIRVTPAQPDVGGRSVAHWFDGLAMLNRFGIADGTVSYASRFIDSDARRKALAENRPPSGGFGADPCRTLFQRVQSIFRPEITDNPNVNLTRLGNEYLAMTETPMPIRFDPGTLATLGHDTAPEAYGQIGTAHPHHDPQRGELVTYGIRLGPRSEYRVFARRSPSEDRLVAALRTRQPAYMHSFGLTEHHALLLENPLVVNPVRLATGGGFIKHFRWKPELGMRIHALDRETGERRASWRLPARFVFHTINAFEDGDAIQLDVCAFEDASIIELLEMKELRAGTLSAFDGARPQRLTLPVDGRAPSERELADVDLELPRIDYRRRNGRPYTYVYGNGSDGAPFLKRIVKVDVADGSVHTWEEPEAWAGEPIFVPRPGGTEEDDGVLLSVVLDAHAGRSFLLVLDAATLQEQARAHAPHHIPFGFHGQFFGS